LKDNKIDYLNQEEAETKKAKSGSAGIATGIKILAIIMAFFVILILMIVVYYICRQKKKEKESKYKI